MPIFRPGKPWRRLYRATAYDPGTPDTVAVFDGVESDGQWDVASDFNASVVSRAGLYLVTASWGRSARVGNATISVGITINGVRRVIVQALRRDPPYRRGGQENGNGGNEGGDRG